MILVVRRCSLGLEAASSQKISLPSYNSRLLLGRSKFHFLNLYCKNLLITILGIQLVTNKPHIQPISSETEISMSMSTLPDKTPPDMQPKHLEARIHLLFLEIVRFQLKTLPPPLSIESNEIPEEVKPTTRSPISFDYRRSEGFPFLL